MLQYAGPDVQCQSTCDLSEDGTVGMVTEPEDQELYLMCLCEQPHSASGLRTKKKKKGKETIIGFLVSWGSEVTKSFVKLVLYYVCESLAS